MRFFFFISIILLSLSVFATEADSHLAQAKKYQLELKEKFSVERSRLKNAISTGEPVDPNQFSLEFKKLNFKIYAELVKHLRRADQPVSENQSARKALALYRKNLSELEYQDLKVDKSFDMIQDHFQNLSDRVFQSHWSLFLDYISWQYAAVLEKPSGLTNLIVTNKGVCPGVSYAKENKFFSFFMDACFLQTTGGVTSIDPAVTYIQSNISATGLKTSIGAGYFVSSFGSELGLKLPLLLVSQKLEDPPAVGYTVKEGTNLIPMLGFYSRIPVGTFFIQTEFSRYLKEDQVLWSLGIGHKF